MKGELTRVQESPKVLRYCKSKNIRIEKQMEYTSVSIGIFFSQIEKMKL